MATWARIVPCCDVEARPIVIGRWRCPRCGAEHADEVVAWREVTDAAPVAFAPDQRVRPRPIIDDLIPRFDEPSPGAPA